MPMKVIDDDDEGTDNTNIDLCNDEKKNNYY